MKNHSIGIQPLKFTRTVYEVGPMRMRRVDHARAVGGPAAGPSPATPPTLPHQRWLSPTAPKLIAFLYAQHPAANCALNSSATFSYRNIPNPSDALNDQSEARSQALFFADAKPQLPQWIPPAAVQANSTFDTKCHR